MTFSALNYFLFLPLVFLAHHFSPAGFRWVVLLVASFLFYAALKVPHLLVVLLAVSAISYGFGLWLGNCKDEKGRLRILWGGIGSNLLILVLLKYLPFLSRVLNQLFTVVSPGASIPSAKVIVSIGVSYYVFQAISYLVDIYLETAEPERHYGYFILYLGFFPKLLQGPIERATDLLPQLHRHYSFSYENVRSGLLIFTWGLFKKVVIADRLAPLVNLAYDNVHAYSGGAFLLATYLFALQIYFDFSGYTDMALGSARLFNINLTENFNSPYFARSTAEFWRRWHISFSRWILDYIFKPLQISLRNWREYGMAVALLLTFLISGLWHGANWQFVVWGGLHGLYLSASVFYKPWQKKIHSALNLKKNPILGYWQMFVTFHLVCFAWIFFRASSIADAAYVVKSIFSGTGFIRSLQAYLDALLADRLEIYLLVFALIMVGIRHASAQVFAARLESLPFWIRWPAYYSLAMMVIVLGVYGSKSKFIYFNF